MKDSVVVFVICLMVVGGVAAWWMLTPTHPLNEAVHQEVQEPAPAPASAPAANVKPRLKPAAPPIVEQPVAAETAPAPVAPPPVPVVRPDPPPFPAVAQIASGAHEDAITVKYGDPALSAVTSTGGHMVETFVYARDHGRMTTVIRLEDGKVATAYSQALPPVPTGLSAPRRF